MDTYGFDTGGVYGFRGLRGLYVFRVLTYRCLENYNRVWGHVIERRSENTVLETSTILPFPTKAVPTFTTPFYNLSNAQDDTPVDQYVTLLPVQALG